MALSESEPERDMRSHRGLPSAKLKQGKRGLIAELRTVRTMRMGNSACNTLHLKMLWRLYVRLRVFHSLPHANQCGVGPFRSPIAASEGMEVSCGKLIVASRGPRFAGAPCVCTVRNSVMNRNLTQRVKTEKSIGYPPLLNSSSPMSFSNNRIFSGA